MREYEYSNLHTNANSEILEQGADFLQQMIETMQMKRFVASPCLVLAKTMSSHRKNSKAAPSIAESNDCPKRIRT